jgi:hypothetical protein
MVVDEDSPDDDIVDADDDMEGDSERFVYFFVVFHAPDLITFTKFVASKFTALLRKYSAWIA